MAALPRMTFWLSLAFGFVLAMNAAAGLKNADCLECHSDKTLWKTNAAGKGISLFVDAAKLAASAHRTNSCAGCHADITEKHPDDEVAAKPVQCATCHEGQTASYNASVHGLALKAGHADAATCQDCHDSHEIIAPTSVLSPLHVTRQAETCGACHDQEAKDWAMSVHGKALAEGKRDAPTCTDCHSEHKIESLAGHDAQKISVDVCSRCHASERLNTKYRLPHDRVKTFFDSYHGLASQYGSTLAANCGSCHGSHKIFLPRTPTRPFTRRIWWRPAMPPEARARNLRWARSMSMPPRPVRKRAATAWAARSTGGFGGFISC
ncbi:MAG: cytochrome c3 family protein [Verrucomicrobiota bacterium]